MWSLAGRSARRGAQLARLLARLPDAEALCEPLSVRSELVSLAHFRCSGAWHPAAAFSAQAQPAAAAAAGRAAAPPSRPKRAPARRQARGPAAREAFQEPAADDAELAARLGKLADAGQPQSMVQLVNHTLEAWAKAAEPRPRPSEATVLRFLEALLSSPVLKHFNAAAWMERLHGEWGVPRSHALAHWRLRALAAGRQPSAAALQLLDDMQGWGLEPGWQAHIHSLAVCTVHRDSRSASRVLQRAERRGLAEAGLDEAQRDALAGALHSLAVAASRLGDVRDSVAFIGLQQRLGRGPQPPMIQETLQTATEQADPAAALDLLDLLRTACEKAGAPFVVDEGQCLALLSCAASCESRQLAAASWRLLRASLAAAAHPGVVRHPVPAAFHAYIHAMARERQHRAAFEAVAELAAAHPGRPHAWHGDLQPLVDGLAAFPGALGLAQRTVEDMVLQGEPVSSAVSDCVVAAAGRVRDVKRAFELFDFFAGLGLGPTTDSYCAVLHACTRNGVLDSVPMILREWGGRGLPASAALWAEVVWWHIVAQDGPGAAAALADMAAAGFPPDGRLLDAAAARLERCGDGAAAQALAEQMAENNWRNHAAKYKIGRWRKTLGLSALIPHRGFAPRQAPPSTGKGGGGGGGGEGKAKRGAGG